MGNDSYSTRGVGKAGFCGLCALRDQKVSKALANLYFRKLKAPAINAWLLEQTGKAWDRRVIYRHAGHVRHPKDRIVSAISARQKRDGTLPQEVSEEQFLRSIVSAASHNLETDPESVTTDQGIKASAALMQARANRQHGISVLVMTLTRGLDATPLLLRGGDDVIEGEVVEA